MVRPLVLLGILMGFSFFTTIELKAQSANNKNKYDVEMNREQRMIHADFIEKEANAHKKVAECFRTKRLIKDCLEEHTKNCPLAQEHNCYLSEEHENHTNHRHHHHTQHENHD